MRFLNFFRRAPDDVSRKTPGFEEAGERRTPKVGIVLLVIMFFAGVFFGWRALDDLSRVPDTPPSLSYCSSRYLTPGAPAARSSLAREYPYGESSYYGGFYPESQQCQFNDIEQRYGIPAIVGERKPFEDQISNLYRDQQSPQSALEDSRRRRQDLENQYGIGLQEKGAGVPRQIFPITPEVQQQILALRDAERELEAKIAELGSEIAAIETKLKVIDERLSAAYQPVFEEHNQRLRFYEFKVFLLQFAVILPLFWIAFWAYRRMLAKDSPYTIIFTGIIAVVGILLLRVILFWFWDLFLAHIIEILWRWIASVQIIRSLVFYLGMVLSFLIFGGAVYYLQKRIFDPRRVAIRRFRAKQCPHCQTSLDLAGAHCPNCGEKVRDRCSGCGQLRYVGLPACPNCGARV